MRKLITVALASSVFGGAIGALATAATQSQASPAAIAAAVQRVEDIKADRTLREVKSDTQRNGFMEWELLSKICQSVTPSVALGCIIKAPYPAP